MGGYHLPVDVRIADRLDKVVLVPRDASLGHSLFVALAHALSPIIVTRSAEGVSIKPFDAEALLAFRTIDQFHLHWSEEAKRFAENRRFVKSTHERVRANLNALVRGGRPAAEKFLNVDGGLSALDDHQWVNVAAMSSTDVFGLCLFDEQGAGKTVTVVHVFDVLAGRDQIDFALILAPKSMVPEWPGDFRKFKGDLYTIAVLAGDRHEKRRGLARPADVFVTNFETAVSMESELGLLARGRGRGMLVVDESFFAKNLDARRTTAIRRVREWFDRAYVLCGTPAPNGPADLVQQFAIVDFGYTFDGVSMPKDRTAAIPVAQSAIEQRGIYLRHLKTDVLPNLPAKHFNRVIVPMEPEQSRLYAGALRTLVSDVSAVSAPEFRSNRMSFLARRMALLQICSHPVSLYSDYGELPCKLVALDSLLDDLIRGRKEKIVLWSYFTATIDALVSRYRLYNPVRYDGSITDVDDRRKAVAAFQDDESTMLFIGNPAAAGAGLTLHRARYSIYESLSNQAAHYLQSLDRIHRRGQTQQVEYLILLCENTIEIDEYDKLLAKETSAQQLLSDDVAAPWTRETFLADLLRAMNLLPPDHANASRDL